MTNPTTRTPASPPGTLPPGAPHYDGAETSRRAGPGSRPRPEDDDTTIDGETDRVEIGDPVPEKDRTVRAVESEGLIPGEDQANVDPDPDPSDERL
jgi:hypothetical protein